MGWKWPGFTGRNGLLLGDPLVGRDVYPGSILEQKSVHTEIERSPGLVNGGRRPMGYLPPAGQGKAGPEVK